jgi:hypothetical protein
MKFHLAMLAFGLSLGSAQAGDWCGDHDKYEIPETTLEIRAAGKKVLVPVIATYHVMDHYQFTLLSPDDGFWIPQTKAKEFALQFDEAATAIRVPKSTLKLGIMPSAPAWFCRKFVSWVYFRINAKPWGEEQPQGAKHARLKQFEEARIDCDPQHHKSLAECVKQTVFDLPAKARLTGEPSVEKGWGPFGDYVGLILRTEDGRKVPIQADGLSKADFTCVEKLVANGAKSLALYGKTADAGTEFERFQASDVAEPCSP